MGSYDIYKVPSDNYDEQKCDVNAQKEDVYWEELLTWLNTSCCLLESFCYVTEALVFPCFVTQVSNGTGCTKRTFWIQQCPLHHCGSLLLMVTPLHMSQKILPSARYTLSKLSEISGLSLSVPHLGTNPLLYSGCPECDCFWSYSVSPGKYWANVSITITMVYFHFWSCGVWRCTSG